MSHAPALTAQQKAMFLAFSHYLAWAFERYQGPGSSTYYALEAGLLPASASGAVFAEKQREAGRAPINKKWKGRK